MLWKMSPIETADCWTKIEISRHMQRMEDLETKIVVWWLPLRNYDQWFKSSSRGVLIVALSGAVDGFSMQTTSETEGQTHTAEIDDCPLVILLMHLPDHATSLLLDAWSCFASAVLRSRTPKTLSNSCPSGPGMAEIRLILTSSCDKGTYTENASTI